VGASANLGAARLEAVAIQMEAAAKRGDLTAVRDLLPSLQKRFASASSALANL
jgi:HPt (histidine-containing phosphotransfer) domain-containing protein